MSLRDPWPCGKHPSQMLPCPYCDPPRPSYEQTELDELRAAHSTLLEKLRGLEGELRESANGWARESKGYTKPTNKSICMSYSEAFKVAADRLAALLNEGGPGE